MRAVALLALVSGCSLYFAPSAPGDDGPPPDARLVPPDAWIPPNPGERDVMARCEDGRLYAVTTNEVWPDAPGHGAGRLVGTCGGACRSATVTCARPDCSDAASTLCGAPASLGATCSLDGASCSGAASIECPEATTCGYAVPGSSCTCSEGRYHCAQLTPAAATQARLVGKWRGTVTTPWVPPYPVTLWIYPDGTYWAECESRSCTAFYYGGDGPSPHRTITILSTSETAGSWADVAIEFSSPEPNTGAIAALSVDATTLRFTFFASWFGCGQPIAFDLTRY
jgi:hypothetical protein